MSDTLPQVIIFAGTEVNWFNRSAGVYRLASELRLHGYETQVIPNCSFLSKKGFQQVFKKYGSDRLLWVGFSTTFLVTQSAEVHQRLEEVWNNSPDQIIDDPSDFNFATGIQNLNKGSQLFLYSQETLECILQQAQVYNKNCKMVFGGAMSHFIARQQTTHPDMFFIHGEAERSAITFSANCEQGIFQNVIEPNGSWNDIEFKTSTTTYRPTDFISPNEWLPIEVSRGCSFRCAYCSYDRRDTRDSYKNPESLRNELISLYEQYGVTRFIIMDDLYNDSREKVKLLHEQVWSKLPFKPELAGYLRLDMLWNQPDQAQLLLDSGWKFASFGVETMHDRAGSKVGKGLGEKRIKETIAMCNKVWNQQLIMHIMMIAGLPFEPKESIESNFNWLADNDDVLSVVIQPLYIEPPAIAKSDISIQPEKFNISCVDNRNWTNDQGVTRTWAQDFCTKVANRKLHMHFSGYADHRAIGISHDDIVDVLRRKDNVARNRWQQHRFLLAQTRLSKIIG